jgi:hypothetical protein
MSKLSNRRKCAVWSIFNIFLSLENINARHFLVYKLKKRNEKNSHPFPRKRKKSETTLISAIKIVQKFKNSLKIKSVKYGRKISGDVHCMLVGIHKKNLDRICD